MHAALAVWAIKTLLLQVPEPELYYPAGVELTLVLTKPVIALAVTSPPATPPRLTDDERARMAAVLAELPTRTHAALLQPPLGSHQRHVHRFPR